MKKLACLLGILLGGQILASAIGLELLYPLGGEKLPGNGTHIFTWTNSDSLYMNLYLDWYDTNGSLIIGSNALYEVTLPAGTNAFTFYTPSNYPGPEAFQYKVHLVGTNSGTTVESSSGYVSVTAPALFTGIIGNTNQWLPEQTRDVSISWTGFQTNDTYDIIVEAASLDKPAYGFLVTNVMMGFESGTQMITLPYPVNSAPAYPPASYSLMDGTHSFSVLNRRCGIAQTIGTIDILTPGFSMSLLSSDTTNVMRGETAVCAKVHLDATLATNDVTVTLVKLVLTSYSSNTLALKCTLSSLISTQSTANVSVDPQASEQFDTIVEFPMNVAVPQGTVTELILASEVLTESGLGTFIWNTQNGATNILASITAVYSDSSAVSSRIISSSGSYMYIDEAVHPRFISSTIRGATVVYGILCRPQVPYLLLTSSDLNEWFPIFTTNGASGTIQVVVPNQGDYHFFRILETNSTPIEMPGTLPSSQMSKMTELRNMTLSATSSSRTKKPAVSVAFWSLKHPEWPPFPDNMGCRVIVIDGKTYIDDRNHP